MLIEQDALVVDGVAEAAGALVGRLPADQALGLRLLALARSAAAIHMAQVTGTSAPAAPRLDGSQAAALLKAVRP